VYHVPVPLRRTTGSPLFSVLLAFVILREQIIVVQIIGGILVGAALYLVNRTHADKREADVGIEAVEEAM